MTKRKKKTRKVRAPLFAQRVAPNAPKGPAEPRQVAAHREPADEHAATELVIYIENESDLSPDGPSGQGHQILLNMLRKWKKGVYDPTLAVRQFEWLTEAGAKRYAKEFGEAKDWSTMFNPATRHEAAKQLEASFRNSAEHGEYDHIDTRIGVRENVEEHVEARGKTRIDKLRADLPPGYSIWTYSPGDGVTRYRFFKNAPPNQSYFGPDDGIYTALGYKEAEAFARGLMSESGRAHETRKAHVTERKYSMTYGELPPFEQFEEDIRRPDPDHNDHPYWPEYTRYPMELTGDREIELAERYGLPEFVPDRRRTGRNTRVRGFNADEREMYGFLEYLVEQFNDGDEEAGDLASTIMSTLGYEWI
jgi:hypothetical protein